jgi:hypothetical protein
MRLNGRDLILIDLAVPWPNTARIPDIRGLHLGILMTLSATWAPSAARNAGAGRCASSALRQGGNGARPGRALADFACVHGSVIEELKHDEKGQRRQCEEQIERNEHCVTPSGYGDSGGRR